MNTGSCCTRHSATGFSSPSVLKYLQGTLLMFHWRGIRDQYPAFCDRRFDQIVLKSSPDFSFMENFADTSLKRYAGSVPGILWPEIWTDRTKVPPDSWRTSLILHRRGMRDQYLTTHYRIFDQLQGIWSQIQTMPLLNPPGSKLNHFPPVTPITATFKQIRSQDRSTDNFVPSYHPTVQ